MKIRVYSFLIVLMFMCCTQVNAEVARTNSNSQINQLQQYRTKAKLYAPNFVQLGTEASFRVFTVPNANVQVVLDYGSYIEKEHCNVVANENGVAIAKVNILDDEDLVGKSVAVDAFILDENKKVLSQAVMQTEKGTPAPSNRIYIVEKNSGKGVLFTPWQTLNTVIMNNSYDERSGYDPARDQIYYDETPAYIKNMRDAQDNVR